MRRILVGIGIVVLMLSFAGVAGAAPAQSKRTSVVKQFLVWLQGKLILPLPGPAEDEGKLILPHPTQES